MLKGETNMSQEEILDEKYEMDSPDSGNETIAAKSIKAKGKVTDTQMTDSKSSMMNGMMSAMAAMPKEQVANITGQITFLMMQLLKMQLLLQLNHLQHLVL
jgi:hypothetical protein